MILNGCTETETVTDTVTEEKIMLMEKPDPSLTKVEVRTDGMLSDALDLGYGHIHPFSMQSQVLVDMKFYDKYPIARGDIKT